MILRNVGQALVMHNSLDVLLAIKYLRPDPGLGHLLPEEGGRAFCRQTLVQRERWLPLVKDSSVLGLKIFLAPLTGARALCISEPSEAIMVGL